MTLNVIAWNMALLHLVFISECTGSHFTHAVLGT